MDREWIVSEWLTDLRARGARDLGTSRFGRQRTVTVLKGREKHNGTWDNIALFHRFRSVHDSIYTNGTPAAQNLQGMTLNCINHPRQRECHSSRKPSRRRCLHPLRSTTRLVGVGGGMIKSYNKSVLPSSGLSRKPRTLRGDRRSSLHLRQPFRTRLATYSLR